MYLKIILLFILFSLYLSKKRYNGIVQRKIKKENYLIIFLLYALFAIGFTYITGILSSGYHLIDDHEVYTYGRNLSELGLVQALKKILSDDMMGITNSRFRFTYVIIRVLQIYILKDNFMMWHLTYAVLTAVNMFLAYAFARKQSCSSWAAYAFSIIIFIGGGQSAVIWRLGPQENLGLLILFMLLLYMMREQHKRKTIMLAVLTILLGGIKESFLMLLPAMPVMMSIWDVRNLDGNVTLNSLAESIKKNKIYTAITGFVFLVDIAIIVFVVGTNSNGYAGVDTSAELKTVVYNMYCVLTGRLKVYLLLSVLGIIASGFCISMCRKERKVTKREIVDKFIIYGLLYGYIFMTQIVLYLKSGMFERYLLPSVAVFAILWMIDLHAEVNHLDLSVVYRVFLLLAVTVLVLIGTDQKGALKYAKDGTDLNAVFSQVAELSGNGTKVVVGIAYEEDFSTSVYLQEHCGIDTVYNVYVTGIEEGMVKDCYNSNSYGLQSIAVVDADIYIDYQGSLEGVFSEYEVDKSLYMEYEYGSYRILIMG